jgi:hypothetical protein
MSLKFLIIIVVCMFSCMKYFITFVIKFVVYLCTDRFTPSSSGSANTAMTSKHKENVNKTAVMLCFVQRT